MGAFGRYGRRIVIDVSIQSPLYAMLNPIEIDVAEIVSRDARVTIIEILVDADVESSVHINEGTLGRAL